jgi:hypothetical protein
LYPCLVIARGPRDHRGPRAGSSWPGNLQAIKPRTRQSNRRYDRTARRRPCAGRIVAQPENARSFRQIFPKEARLNSRRAGRSPTEPSPNLRNNSSVVTRNDGRPRQPSADLSAMSLRAISVSTGSAATNSSPTSCSASARLDRPTAHPRSPKASCLVAPLRGSRWAPWAALIVAAADAGASPARHPLRAVPAGHCRRRPGPGARIR